MLTAENKMINEVRISEAAMTTLMNELYMSNDENVTVWLEFLHTNDGEKYVHGVPYICNVPVYFSGTVAFCEVEMANMIGVYRAPVVELEVKRNSKPTIETTSPVQYDPEN